MRLVLNISLVLTFHLTAIGQFTYFNSISGEFGDGIPVQCANVEVYGDSIYVFGLSYDSGEPYLLLRIYDAEGVIIDQNEIFFPDAFIYTGRTASFKRIPGTSDFLFSQGYVDQDSEFGYLIRFDAGLDSIWTKKIVVYPPETYFYTHTVNEDGFLIAGEQAIIDVGRGTFILQTDFDGDTLWHREVHAPEEGVFRNRWVIDQGERIIWSGGSGLGENTEGRVEILDSTGLLLNVVESEGGLIRGVMNCLENDEGEVIVYQSIVDEPYDGISDDQIGLNTVRVYQLDTDQAELIEMSEFFQGQEWINGYPTKMIEVEDGYVMAGGLIVNGVDEHHYIGWIMKIDDAYQQEWYTELSFDGEESSTHFLWDVEQTSDGGYVTVGEYYNDEDPFRRTWLVKLDACGDLEWQGCEPVGIHDWNIQHSRLELYPNPVNDIINIESNTNIEWDEIRIIDILGQEIKRERIFNSTINVAELGTGIYVLTLYSKGLPIHSQKFMKE